jgi:hypothetical protein
VCFDSVPHTRCCVNLEKCIPYFDILGGYAVDNVVENSSSKWFFSQSGELRALLQQAPIVDNSATGCME